VNKYEDNYILWGVAEHIKKISHIDTSGWDLMKLATALKMVCYPAKKIEAATRVSSNIMWMCMHWMSAFHSANANVFLSFFRLFRKQQLKRFRDDAPKYKRKIMKVPWLEIYNEMYNARKMRLDAAKVLLDLLKRAEKAYEAENAFEAARDHKIGPLAPPP
jgi:nucleolar protein 58